MSVRSALKEFGLTPRQSEIYLVLTKNGSMSVAEIARYTGIPRVSVYSCLEELQRREIISQIKRNKRQLYEAQSPTILLQLLKQRTALFELVIPELQSMIKGKGKNFSTRIYEGYEQSRQAQRDFYERLSLEKVKLVQSISHPELAKKFPKFVPLMIERRKQMGIGTQLIVSAEQRKNIPTVFKGRDREIRFLPEKFPFNCTALVGGSNILFIITQTTEPTAILIHSKPISGMLSACFAFIWQQIGEPSKFN